ncbi:MAG: hypothetical protein ACOCP4_05625 [Candidatus Woesearchaeota archaeon]
MNKYSKEYIKSKLSKDQGWLERGVIALYRKQTEDEQGSKNTRHRNGKGFNIADAKYLSFIAEYLLSGNHLSGYHIEKVRNKMLKYSGQLARIANEE